MSMFAKAVEQKRNAEPRKPATLEQQLFPSSSPANNHTANRQNLQQFRFSQNVLQPSSSSAYNAVPKRGIATGTLKRTSSEANMDYGSSSGNIGGGPSERILKKAMSSLGQSAVSKLHDNVDFDENYNGNVAAMQDSRSPSDLTISYPDLSGHQGMTSSASVPWSSSPPEHLQHRLYPSLPTCLPTTVQAKTGTEVASEFRAKRRRLPWIAERDADDMDNPLGSSASHLKHAQQKHDARDTIFIPGSTSLSRALQSSKTKVQPIATLGPTKSPYVWDKTASAIKNEQKQVRLAAKKQQLVKTFENEDSDVKAKIEKDMKRKNPAKVFLSEEQHKVLKIVSEEKKSLFFTGSAGTGKSVLLRQIIRHFREFYKREPERVAVTASTGLAACNVGGVTLHSFAGIGLGKEPVPELVKKIKRNAKAKTRWMKTRVLIIDEISMVDGELFDKLEAIARTIRNNGRPFGGIQLVVTGDFFQLPPVPDHSSRTAKFAFDALTWNTSIDHTIGLTQVFRQKDPVFADMLNEMRLGNISPLSVATFKRLSRPLAFNDEFEATELFPTRSEVDRANNQRMGNLGGSSIDFTALDGGTMMDLQQREKLLSNCMAPQKITLKKGAQVMLIKNIDETLVNGSLGKVIAFMDEKTFDIYDEDEDMFQAAGGTQDPASRGRSKLKDLLNTQGNIGANASTTQKWPLVRFHISDGTTRDLLCQHESWKIELPNGEVQASRNQVPLILAWALSIHKAQGQTLERVKVDLGRIFEKGQAYVALSRATCQEGLQVLRFDATKVMAHDRVKSFYRSLYGVSSLSGFEKKPEVAPDHYVGSKVSVKQDEGKAIKSESAQFIKQENQWMEQEEKQPIQPVVGKSVNKPPERKFVKPKSTPEHDEFADDFLDDEDVLAEMYRLEH